MVYPITKRIFYPLTRLWTKKINGLNNIPKETVVVTESGIKTKADIKLMHQHQVYAFLVGEAFMRAEVPGQQLSELFEL